MIDCGPGRPRSGPQSNQKAGYKTMTEDTLAAKSGTNENTSQGDEKKPATFFLTMDKHVDLALAIVLILFGIFLCVMASTFYMGRVDDFFTAKGMPYATGTFLIICGIILTVLRLASWSEIPGHFVVSEAVKEDEEGYPASWKRAFAIIAASWIALWLWRSLGYVIVTPLFLIAVLWFMGERKWKKIILFSIIFGFASWYLFSQILNFMIPLGVLEPLARSLGFLL